MFLALCHALESIQEIRPRWQQIETADVINNTERASEKARSFDTKPIGRAGLQPANTCLHQPCQAASLTYSSSERREFQLTDCG